jgi:hypothetical protein
MDVAALLLILPQLNDAEYNKILRDPNTFYYNKRMIPEAYQNSVGSGVDHFHSIHYKIGPDPFGGANGNKDFPWASAGGTNYVKRGTFHDVKFISLPEQKPIVVFRKRRPIFNVQGGPLLAVRGRLVNEGDSTLGWDWRFPLNTVVGEILMAKHNGYSYVFEIRARVRTKTDSQGGWEPVIFRPYPEPKDLYDKLVSLDRQDLATQVKNAVDNQKKLRRTTDRRMHRRQRGINVTAYRWDIPKLSPQVSKKLLTTEAFKDATQSTLAVRNPHNELSLYPPGYDTAFVGGTKQSCFNCHRDTGVSVNKFDLGRDWYGRIRGGDGIFSFHPASPSVISTNGFNIPVKLNQDLLDKGIIEVFNAGKHSSEDYEFN